MTDTDLSGSTFKRGKLRGIRCEDADLGSRFGNVNLSGAMLRDANLSGLVITDANLTGASISECCIDQMTIDGIAVADFMKAYRMLGNSNALQLSQAASLLC